VNYRAIAVSVIGLVALAACGGGAGSNGAMFVAPVISAPGSSQQSLATATFATPARGTQSGFAMGNGFAVYVFDLDLTTAGTSACVATCAAFWPPIAVPAGATLVAPFGTIHRPDGSLQLAYNGRPLYTYAQDSTAGIASGDGLTVSGGLWHLASGQLQP
jgi:predicted lipoprotein with Yx(FWY)xxD motif